ncbi:MAG: Nudix family hydrolase [Azoarcus sp.]|jgi:8-oxo-dGTP diphosphatase|nr:Nudix family hydrolase [Azoarcus sp.]
MSRKITHVAAGVIVRNDGHFLLGQRAPGSFYPGYWEFPGGKVEPGESPAGALRRELLEELGIHVERLTPWIVREHEYEHAKVRLYFFEVSRWQGTIRAHVHSALAWAAPGDAEYPAPMLPANGLVLKALSLPRVMGITHAGAIGVDVQLAALDRALAAGLRLVQIREPALSASGLRTFATDVVRRVRAAGALAVVNGAPELALEAGADGLHLSAERLASIASRPAPDFAWVGASCHTRAELERAAALGLDYALLGAVKSTPTHPGGGTLGWEGFTTLAAGLPLPVFALGGLTIADMETALEAGAHGVATIRGVWFTDKRLGSQSST